MNPYREPDHDTGAPWPIENPYVIAALLVACLACLATAAHHGAGGIAGIAGAAAAALAALATLSVAYREPSS